MAPGRADLIKIYFARSPFGRFKANFAPPFDALSPSFPICNIPRLCEGVKPRSPLVVASRIFGRGREIIEIRIVHYECQYNIRADLRDSARGLRMRSSGAPPIEPVSQIGRQSPAARRLSGKSPISPAYRSDNLGDMRKNARSRRALVDAANQNLARTYIASPSGRPFSARLRANGLGVSYRSYSHRH